LAEFEYKLNISAFLCMFWFSETKLKFWDCSNFCAHENFQTILFWNANPNYRYCFLILRAVTSPTQLRGRKHF